MFTVLSEQQLQQRLDFIKHYTSSRNAADGSTLDSNANVTSKNVATMQAEIYKDENIQVNRRVVTDKLVEMFDYQTAQDYLQQIKSHLIYVHDETSLLNPYCCAVSLYPFLLNGLLDLGGESEKPTHVDSFCGTFVNLILALSSQFAGAVATAEFLICFDHFARKDFGANYLETHTDFLKQKLQHVVYLINQPAVSRAFQSAFWNVSVFDHGFLKGLFEHFSFPNGDKVDIESTYRLQKFFLHWLGEERKKKILTFPVTTACMLNDKNGKPLDSDFADFLAEEMSIGNSFFIYNSDNVSSLSSCCRLKSEINDKTFSHTLGNVGVMTGSIRVITLNMNRLVQMAAATCEEHENINDVIEGMLTEEIKSIHRFHAAHRNVLEAMKAKGMYPAYDAGYISLNKQYSTIGINGMVEAAEFLGITPKNNKRYIDFITRNLKKISELNKAGREQYGFMLNTEFVPAENLGVKNAKWDRESGLNVPRDCYNSYFYPVEDESINVLDKFILHGKEIVQYLDGGSALHLNLEEHLTKEQYLEMFELAGKLGCDYWCVNVLTTICNECGKIEKKKLFECPICGSTNIDYATRIIGYLKRISSFSSDRQKEAAKRIYHKAV